MTIFTRRQIETILAAFLAAVTAMVGIANRSSEEVLGPKFLTLEKVGRFNQPVHLSQPPGVDSPLFVVEREGVVRAISGGAIAPRPFLDIRPRVKSTGKGGEQGLLSIAFPPDYAAAGRFYVAYTDDSDALVISEFRRSPEDPLLADAKSERVLLRIPEPTTKHHGGLLLFGPDKYLYIGSGDGGLVGDPSNDAQNKEILNGKLLRIDPRKRGSRPYTVPKENPFVGRAGRDEIFAYGLRNPWRFSFDQTPAAAVIAIADVGNRSQEEVNILPLPKARGANFGWPAFEGDLRTLGGLKPGRTVLPVYTYTHGRRCSVIGGNVVRDPRLARIKGREIVGAYLFGDFCSKRLFAFRPKPNKVGQERSFRFNLPGVTSFGEDRAGRIYVLTYEGPIYRIDPARKRVG